MLIVSAQTTSRGGNDVKLSDLQEVESISMRLKSHRAMVAALGAMISNPPAADAPKAVMLSFGGSWFGGLGFLDGFDRDKYAGSMWLDQTDPKFPSIATMVIWSTEALIADELRQLQALGITEESRRPIQVAIEEMLAVTDEPKAPDYAQAIRKARETGSSPPKDWPQEQTFPRTVVEQDDAAREAYRNEELATLIADRRGVGWQNYSPEQREEIRALARLVRLRLKKIKDNRAGTGLPSDQ
jgi:hypothetical protein